MARKLLRAVLLALPAAVAADSALWLWATARLRDGYREWAQATQSAGWSVEAGTPRQAGWPFAAELVLPGLTIMGDAVPGGVAWTAPQVRLRVDPRRPRILLVLPEGEQRVRLATLPEASITAGALTLLVPLSGTGTAVLSGRAVRAEAAGLTVEAVALEARPLPSGVQVSLSEITLPSKYTWPLGATVEAASADLVVAGPPTPVLPGKSVAEQAAAWRDEGGRVDLPRFGLRWGSLVATGSGSGTLDGALQPAAEATVQMQGWQGALDQLAQGGAVTPGAALAARAVLGLFARASDGVPGAVVVPVSVSAGLLSAGGVPLLRVPPVAWP